ncbi:MAG: amidohydrolase family protein [Planctomycetota bacterium]
MSTLMERARRGEPLADVGIIDIHGHLGWTGCPLPYAPPEEMVAEMDRLAIESVAVSHSRCIYTRPDYGNEKVLAAMRAHPGRILGYVAIHPRSAEWVEEQMTQYIGEGFIGLKLHNANGFPYTDEAYEPALAIANEHRMPVLLHTWGQPETLGQCRELAGRYPDAALLLAHSGVENEPGYIELARDAPNVMLELALSRGPRGLVQRLVEAVGADRVVWGSDAFFMGQAQQIGKVLGARISDEDKVKLLSENARRVLGRVVEQG